jgi:hypothetical protein
MSCSGASDCTCGCCSGIAVETPRAETNRAGLSAIAYRTGVWSSFKSSMLARLSSSDYPALAALKTRDDNDFSIALIDASAMMLDVLTFYQERLANESYLRTATQLASLNQLVRLVGYQPSPGVSASTYLAFTIRAAPGSPSTPTATAVTIPAGTKTQSVPAQGQTPQIFETSADILAKADWNALPVQTGAPWAPLNGDSSIYLAGTSTQLNPGDAILIVRAGASPPYASKDWDIRILTAVETDTAHDRTLVTWSEMLGPDWQGSTFQTALVFALRQRTALFGYNAVNPLLLADKTLAALKTDKQVAGKPPDWRFNVDTVNTSDFTISPLPSLSSESVVDLDAVYAKVKPGGWIVLISPDSSQATSPSGFVALYGIVSVTTLSRSGFGVSAKVSRLGLDTNQDLIAFTHGTRTSSALVQSEALAPAEKPLDHPLYGAQVDLEIVRNDLAGVTAIALSGNRQKIAINPGVTNLVFTPDDLSDPVQLAPGDVLALTEPPKVLKPNGAVPDWSHHSAKLTLSAADSNNRTGTVSARLTDFALSRSSSNDPVVQEFALVSSVATVNSPIPHTRLVLSAPLINCYDRASTSVNANVGAATAGASVTELLGSGSASTPNQTFTLKQSPLTYVSAPTPTGRQDTLTLRANGVAWSEVPSLYGQAANAQVFSVLDQTGGVAQITTGDGVEGAMLPTGTANILANYRVGLGAAGNVAAGTITTLVDRPLGVAGVVNPLAANGGQNPDRVDDIQTSAPLTVVTLGRAVSIEDYQILAETYAGIGKASAIWIPSGRYRGVFITVAAAAGEALPPGSQTLGNLVATLKSYGNPNIAIYPQSFLETIFRIEADLAIDPAYVVAAVQANVTAALYGAYSFAARGFGEGVTGDEIAALIQGVAGIIAVNVKRVQVVATSSAGDIGSAAFSLSAYNSWMASALTKPLPRPHGGATKICPYTPVASLAALPQPAEILVLDPDPQHLVLGTMS